MVTLRRIIVDKLCTEYRITTRNLLVDVETAFWDREKQILRNRVDKQKVSMDPNSHIDIDCY